MVSASIYIPKWLEKQQEEQKNNLPTSLMLLFPYSLISDSTVKVTDDDIESYISKK